MGRCKPCYLGKQSSIPCMLLHFTRFKSLILFKSLSYFIHCLNAFQPETPPARPYEAPTPGSGWTNAPGGSYNDAPTPRDSYGNPLILEFASSDLNYSFVNWLTNEMPDRPCYSCSANAPSPYVPSTPVGQPMTLSSASYLPGTPGQPMTPGNVGMDVMSPMGGLSLLIALLSFL